MHLAEFNSGILRHDWGDPRIAEFADNIDRVNAIAIRSPGFVWMLGEAAMDAAQRDPDGPLGGNPRLASTLSVWESPAHLRRFAFETVHKAFYDKGPLWYGEGQGPRLVMWWVPVGTEPTIADAAARMAQLAAGGAGPEAFGWDWLRQHHPETLA